MSTQPILIGLVLETIIILRLSISLRNERKFNRSLNGEIIRLNAASSTARHEQLARLRAIQGPLCQASAKIDTAIYESGALTTNPDYPE